MVVLDRFEEQVASFLEEWVNAEVQGVKIRVEGSWGNLRVRVERCEIRRKLGFGF